MKVDLEALEALISPRVELLGLEVVLVELVTVQGRATVRVYIDGAQGVSLESCVKVNRLLMDMPEFGLGVAERFDFEVSSPGLERPLRKPEHFQRFIGENVKIKLVRPIDGRRNLIGRIAAVEEGGVAVDIGTATFGVAFSEIARARLQPDPSVLFASVNDSV